MTARPRPRPEGIATSRDFDASARVKAEGTAGRQWSADKAETPVACLSVPDTSRQVRDTVALEKTKAPTEAGATASGPVRDSTVEAEGDPLLAEASRFSRNPFIEVKHKSVSKVVDPDAGRTQVIGVVPRSRRTNLATARQRLLNAWQTLG